MAVNINRPTLPETIAHSCGSWRAMTKMHRDGAELLGTMLNSRRRKKLNHARAALVLNDWARGGPP